MKRNFYFRLSFIESIESNTVNCIREGSILKKPKENVAYLLQTI